MNKKWDIYFVEQRKVDLTKVSVLTYKKILRAFFLDNHKAAALLAILSTQHFGKINDKNIQRKEADFV